MTMKKLIDNYLNKSISKSFWFIILLFTLVILIIYMLSDVLSFHIIIGSIFVGVGIISIINTLEVSNAKLDQSLVYALILVAIGLFLFFVKISQGILIQKLIGLLITIIGYQLAFKIGPKYTAGPFKTFANTFKDTITIIGLITFLFGFYLLIF
jgi:hypothetical protein